MSIQINSSCNTLPAMQIADAVNNTLARCQNIVVTAPPGAGKSTLLPLTILQGLQDGKIDGNGKILMLEPRRLAARQIAERMAQLIDEPVGETIGYRIRFENKVSTNTKIEVLTEGILTRMLVADSMLDGVKVVVFDEFHERSIASDVALALVREAQQIIRPDLKIVIMSATIDAASICNELNAELIESKGRMFPVKIEHVSCDIQPAKPCTDAVVSCTLKAHREQQGDILVFLPGEAEITRCAEQLNGKIGSTHICPLYSRLTQKEQKDAIAPSREGERKVVLATSIAETSITIEGVTTVIDSGLCRTMVFDARNGLSHLQTVRISLDMANQRSGRAGRVAEGVCYRLWSLATEHQMTENRTPEIETADLTPTVLDISAWGEERIENLQWLTAPNTGKTAKAKELLSMLGALDAEGNITMHGKQMAALPCHPRIANMLVSARPEQKVLACDIAALIEERDPLNIKDSSSERIPDCDINTRLATLYSQRAVYKIQNRWQNIEKVSMHYRSMLRNISRASATEQNNVSPDITGTLIASAYPERIAILNGSTYTMACGDMVRIDANDDMSACSMIAVATISGGSNAMVTLASPVNAEDIVHLATSRDNITWDNKQGCIVAQREQRIGCLTLSKQPLNTDLCPDLQQQIVNTVCEAAKKYGTSMFNFDEKVQNLQLRVATVAGWHPELELPDLSTDNVLAISMEWLPFYIQKASTATELKKINLCEALWTLLTYEQQQEVDRLAPTHITVPTGSKIKVEYRIGAEQPILRVRLQECFGLTDTPRVNGGKCTVLMELLSPGFKPVQLTQDLKSFWSTTYFEVRKELKRRYPKHSWPDNPLEAEATRGVKSH